MSVRFYLVPFGGIETQSGNDGKGVAVPRINGNPFPFAAAAERTKLIGTDR